MIQDNKENKDKKFVRKNEQIRASKVLLVRDGKNLGTYPTFEALRMAREDGLDLVEVNGASNPPVCSIMDYGKHIYEQQKKKKGQKASQQKEKEISFRYVINDNDLKTKANQVRVFIEKGYKVKLTVKFKARENAHKDQGFVVIKHCLDLLKDVAIPEKPPVLEGNNITCRLDAKK